MRVRIIERLVRNVEVAPWAQHKIQHVLQGRIERCQRVFASVAESTDLPCHMLKGLTQRFRLRHQCQLEAVLHPNLKVRLLHAEKGSKDHRLRLAPRIAQRDAEAPCLRGRHRKRKLPWLSDHPHRTARRLHEASRNGANVVGDEKTLLRQSSAIPHQRLKQLDDVRHPRSRRPGKGDRPHARLLRSERIAQLSPGKLRIQIDGIMRELPMRHLPALLRARPRQRDHLAHFEDITFVRSIATLPAHKIINRLFPFRRCHSQRLGRVNGDELRLEHRPNVSAQRNRRE